MRERVDELDDGRLELIIPSSLIHGFRSRTANQRRELVGEDFVGGVNEDVIAVELLGMQLRADVSHQVDDQAFVATREDDALEAGRVLTDL
ncbi:MAG TPA: hypothetical protein VH165_17875 [Kofleriaceae bacterium]|nr:hypothetical protein [Kofleriaceae bacterium]